MTTLRMLRQRLPRVCVPVFGKNPAEMADKAELVVRDNPFIEFRLDYLPHPALLLPKLKAFLEYNPHATLIATCRRVKSGGKFKGSVAAQMDILNKAAAMGCNMVDVELETADHLKTADWNKLKKNAAVILSFHDFRGTKRLEDTFRKMEAFPADFVKIVTTASSLYDNVVLMKFLEAKSDQRHMIASCMGEQGIISRLLAVRAGSVFTFGA
ncbi:MAG: type I 3-dehydroquinate dehydratase, partial [Terriglobales bacterium]